MKHSRQIGERVFDDDGTMLTVKKTYDVQPTLDAVQQLRSVGASSFGESKHVGRVPGWMITEWLKEAGVRWDDIPARNEVIRKKMMSGEFSALRNWEGTY